MLLEGKTAVVTGCNRGIGKAILENFAKNGADVFAVVRKETDEFLKEVERIREENNVNIYPIYADFSSDDEVKKAGKEIISKKIPIDILVNNIGLGLPVRMSTMTPMDSMRDIFQINFFSSFLFTQIISRYMIRKKSGSIVFISSTAIDDAWSNVEYVASKSAIIGEMKRLALELGPMGIRVNAVAPGLTDTGLADTMTEDDEKLVMYRCIMKRKAKPEEVANTVAFLASEMSSFITSQIIRVDGGLI
ncbi:3-oxoacyl-[acyl-carrier protein] reductase [Lachnospiraceae bacterium NE2001]|nr:3-oxoacyl-[acyl-carrier protein] reductase [Lachnospiraceae bacterium NE2001]